VTTPVRQPPKTPPGERIIRFRNVRKAFGEKVVYTDLSLDVRRGEVLTVMGPSGCGKSVMLKMLIGLLTADGGSIRFDGDEITHMDEEKLAEVRRRIAYLFQGAALFDSMSVGDNVAYGLREQFWNVMTDAEIMARVTESLALVGMPGIEAMRPADLSGGMRKRVGLARTLALQPEVILYDEPTTGLDPINTARINKLILTLKNTLGLTSIVITHDLTTAFHVSDRLAMINKGRIILQGTAEEFRTTSDDFVRSFIEGRAPEGEDVATLLASS
jgi:phospholipid/cholesterol/gamma-HCH transport system ATP-binding protein